ncbi:N-acetyl-gamma-glutamyl-phosphate reductase [Candidatus Ishikawella capsulata]|uniref:N-acetyl-gamma-glutamyl-phosphate reductase n=1 Tax=Candidatus Ishikawaella capsulata Mpkobe TaxID=476281 RepID=C5WC42_9ENTR|nr:N-acetyl-gamma-glutamyl-phosphate reductase [Candidatus Ishikawaella capsulata]BAH82898.1 N-acetyl-gamma-glutamyl-phosphate reductase [Candidatus Ishikawaella capsulata Mpkobe]
MLNTLIVGASGYTGIELAVYLNRHPHINIAGLVISSHSPDIGKKISDIHKHLKSIIDIELEPIRDPLDYGGDIDVVFLATSHMVSHNLAPKFLEVGCIVFDLSGAFRVNDVEFYKKYYNFTHRYKHYLDKAVYGLAEWQKEKIKTAQLISVPGCYPTISHLALKPLVKEDVLDKSQWPVINAISGVSGIGRKAIIDNSFCEVSLQPYGIFHHRHHREIVNFLGIPVIFIPYVCNFQRGILATVTCLLKKGIKEEQILNIYQKYYNDKPLIRLYKKDIPAIKSVVGLPFCDIGFAVKHQHLIVTVAEDNLLKGASSQAIQCLNIRFSFIETLSLI